MSDASTPSAEGFTILIPALDEEAGIVRVLEEIRAALVDCGRPWEILVVDDGSSDDTARLAKDGGARVIQHGANLGYGASLKTGIRRSRHDLLVITDADATYPADRILDLLAAMENVDMVVAARTGDNVRIPLLRRPAKWCLRKLAEYLAGVRIPDLNSGLRVFRRSTVEEYLHLLPNGFSFTTTITLAYHADSRLVRYLPIDYDKRTGSSKIRPIRDTYNFLLIILRTAMYFDPMRVFMPPALVSLFLAVTSLVYELVVYRNLAEKTLILLMMSAMLVSLALLGDLIVRRRG